MSDAPLDLSSAKAKDMAESVRVLKKQMLGRRRGEEPPAAGGRQRSPAKSRIMVAKKPPRSPRLLLPKPGPPQEAPARVVGQQGQLQMVAQPQPQVQLQPQVQQVVVPQPQVHQQPQLYLHNGQLYAVPQQQQLLLQPQQQPQQLPQPQQSQVVNQPAHANALLILTPPRASPKSNTTQAVAGGTVAPVLSKSPRVKIASRRLLDLLRQGEAKQQGDRSGKEDDGEVQIIDFSPGKVHEVINLCDDDDDGDAGGDGTEKSSGTNKETSREGPESRGGDRGDGRVDAASTATLEVTSSGEEDEDGSSGDDLGSDDENGDLSDVSPIQNAVLQSLIEVGSSGCNKVILPRKPKMTMARAVALEEESFHGLWEREEWKLLKHELDQMDEWKPDDDTLFHVLNNCDQFFLSQGRKWRYLMPAGEPASKLYAPPPVEYSYPPGYEHRALLEPIANHLRIDGLFQDRSDHFADPLVALPARFPDPVWAPLVPDNPDLPPDSLVRRVNRLKLAPSDPEARPRMSAAVSGRPTRKRKADGGEARLGLLDRPVPGTAPVVHVWATEETRMTPDQTNPGRDRRVTSAQGSYPAYALITEGLHTVYGDVGKQLYKGLEEEKSPPLLEGVRESKVARLTSCKRSRVASRRGYYRFRFEL